MMGWVAAIAAVIGSVEQNRKSNSGHSPPKKDSDTKAKEPKKEYSSTYEADFTPPVFSTTYFVEPTQTFEPSSSSSDLTSGGGSFDGGGASGDW